MIELRKATLEDFEELLVLFRQLWPSKQIMPERLRTIYINAINAPNKHYLCAIDDSRIVGLGSLSFKENLWQEGEIAYVEELVVHEEMRGKGVGTLLMEHLIALAGERGCRRIELDSAFHRTNAHRLYERLGMEKRAYLFSRVL